MEIGYCWVVISAWSLFKNAAWASALFSEGHKHLLIKLTIMKNLLAINFFLLCLLGAPFTTAANIGLSTDIGGAYLVFGKKMGGKITAKALQSSCELGVAGCAKGSQIFSFQLVVFQNGKRYTYQVEGSNELSPEMRASLANLKVGDTFEFKRIKAYLPNGRDQIDVFAKRFKLI